MTSPLPPPVHLADHPALDLLNTWMMVDGERRDVLASDAQAVSWLAQAGLALPGPATATDQARLLAELKALRTVLEPLVAARRAGRTADPAALNQVLRRTAVQLEWKATGALELQRASHADAVTRRIGELALAAAELLAHGDFSLVRQCESSECTLLFYDRTKSHKRRWCSMALCGNRHKVAEFRKRRQEG